MIEDVKQDPRFAGDVAERVGYAPTSLIAVPLVSDGESLGVLEVLDRPQRPEATLQQTNLLAMFADQASIALELLGHAQRARTILAGDDETGVVARIVESLLRVSDAKRERGLRLLEDFDALLKLS